MNKRIVDTVLSIIVIVVLAVFSAKNAFHEPREMSEMENRELAMFPEMSSETLLDGSFMKEFETYAADQFLGRDSFVSLKADAEKMIGKKGCNGVHFGKDQYLISRPSVVDMDNLDKNIDSIINLNNLGLYNITMAIIPTAFEALNDKLPDYAYDTRITEIQDEIKERTKDTEIKVCDTTKMLRTHQDEYIYYRTDHHQTALGSFYVYNALGEYLGFEPYTLDNYEREMMTDSFLGTSWSKASLTFQEKDIIERFNLKNAEWLHKTMEFPTEDKSMDNIYVMENLEKKDKYSVYLDGNHGLTVIKSNSGTGKKVAVFKDSYAHSIAPFLSDSFDEVHLIDLRYYSDDMIAYMEENKITDVLILYNSEGFASDTNVVKLGEISETSDYFDPPPFGFLPETDRVEDDYFADAAFFGDSLTDGFSYYAEIPAQFFCKTSMSTHSVFTEGIDGVPLIDALLSHDEITKYYIMFGINETRYKTPELFVEDYKKIIDAIRAKNPESLIYIQSILPIEPKAEETDVPKVKIDACNDALVKLAEETDCYYLNVNGYIAEEDGYLRDGAAPDGVHFGALENKKWEEYLHNHAVVEKRRGKTVEAVSIYTGGGNINLNSFAEEMLAGVPFRETLTPVKENVVARVLNLAEGDAVNGIYYTSGGATSEEFAAFEAETPEKAQELGEKLRQHIEKRKSDFENYRPEEMPNLNDPVVVVDGCLAAMCISDDNGAAETVISHY
ncbi:MAG: DUF4358 domain-containing protein [Oscillospiraceae bacterium]|nr:DUF4358 domain-containing protein [Oscillospiraceae bacterium]